MLQDPVDLGRNVRILTPEEAALKNLYQKQGKVGEGKYVLTSTINLVSLELDAEILTVEGTALLPIKTLLLIVGFLHIEV